MRKIVAFTTWIFCLLFFLVAILARPNPVPNDDLNDNDLEKYEQAHDNIHTGSRMTRRRVRGPEDPDDMDVLDELRHLKGFKGIPRRNRDIYHVRRNIFQKFIDAYVAEDDESKD